MSEIETRKVGPFDPKIPWKRLPHPEVQRDSLELRSKIIKILDREGILNLDLQPYTQIEAGLNIRLKPSEAALKDLIVTILVANGAEVKKDEKDTLIYDKMKITIDVVSRI